jgi:hypothetical protein
MKEPYVAPPNPTGSKEGDLKVLGDWLRESDLNVTSDFAHTAPSRNGNTVALLMLGARGPQALTLGWEKSGQYDPDAILTYARPRIKTYIKHVQSFGDGVSLAYAFDVAEGSFDGCARIDDYIGVILARHAAPIPSKLAGLLDLSSGRPRPPVLDD